MPVQREMKRLQTRWAASNGWPKRIEWLEIEGIRAWGGKRLEFNFPMVALAGENGVGKSTVLQAISAIYAPTDEDAPSRFASDYFPATTWDGLAAAAIRASVRQGSTSELTSVRKPGERWRGNPERKKRTVQLISLSRVQPVSERVGYNRLSKSGVEETASESFASEMVERMTAIMGRKYDGLRLATTNIDDSRRITVFSRENNNYSGFHGGTGEVASAELLGFPVPKHSVLLIDEVETSLHPRTQRRLMQDLATLCRLQECQIFVTTHSPYILDELPPEARIFIMDGADGKSVIPGASVEFAMSRMDDEDYPECEVYVEDDDARIMLTEILACTARDLVRRIRIIGFGAANVGRALGQMNAEGRLPRKSLVFLDGDQVAAPGCHILPGDGDPPEVYIFEALREKNWGKLPIQFSGRSPSEIIDACTQAMTLSNHHDWVKYAADRLVVGSDVLWTAMCAVWATDTLDSNTARDTAQIVRDRLEGTS